MTQLKFLGELSGNYQIAHPGFYNRFTKARLLLLIKILSIIPISDLDLSNPIGSVNF